MSAEQTPRHPASSTGKFWTVANLLSLTRLALAVPVAHLIFTNGSLVWILMLVALGIMTDWFDGRLARWTGSVSDWGKVLDPLADKAAALLVVMMLTLRGSLPGWFLGLLLLREALIIGMGVLLTGLIGSVVMSLWWGKVAITAVAITVLVALFNAPPAVTQAGVWITAGLLVYSAGLYLVRFVQLVRNRPAPAAEAAAGPPRRPTVAEEPKIDVQS